MKPKPEDMPAPDEVRKNLGAYYTPDPVATFLTRWAIRDRTDSVLDPSSGEAVFLLAARARVLELGGSVEKQVEGIEVSPGTCQRAERLLGRLPHQPRLRLSNFFDVDPPRRPSVTAVIGNPPFIRYQRFAGEQRELALARTAAAGVTLSALSSSWAPFLVHAVTFIARGGRMAVVAPAELAHARYAKPVLQFLKQSFARVSLLVFERKLFPKLSEDTVLVLAEGKDEPSSGVFVHQLRSSDDLDTWLGENIRDVHASAPREPAGELTRFVEHFLPSRARELYRELSSAPGVVRLAHIADVGIGYVTGHNEFFHLTAGDAAAFSIPGAFLQKSFRTMRGFQGLVFNTSDWRAMQSAGGKNTLLRVPHGATLPTGLRRYLAQGVRQGVARGYKCRVRDPWYAVPHVHVGDAFLSYMSGARTRMVRNAAKAVAPNTLHVVRCRETGPGAAALVATWNSALTTLSCEIEGHGLGGGMLKLEPRESGRVLVPAQSVAGDGLAELDLLSRQGRQAEVDDLVDKALRQSVGLSTADITCLRQAAATLRGRRTRR